jgi:hypothetical protein
MTGSLRVKAHFGFWHIASLRCEAEFGRYPEQARTNQARLMSAHRLLKNPHRYP